MTRYTVQWLCNDGKFHDIWVNAMSVSDAVQIAHRRLIQRRDFDVIVNAA
jgi:hypothetical protein